MTGSLRTLDRYSALLAIPSLDWLLLPLLKLMIKNKLPSLLNNNKTKPHPFELYFRAMKSCATLSFDWTSKHGVNGMKLTRKDLGESSLLNYFVNVYLSLAGVDFFLGISVSDFFS